MPAYVVKNGKLERRQKDYNVPNYRIVPFHSSIGVTSNDYFTSTLNELQKEVQALKHDYRNLNETMWKFFSEIDRANYDAQITFRGLKSEQIYDKIALIRSLNAYEPQEESLRLSAIVRIDDNFIIVGESSSNLVQNSQTSTPATQLKKQELQEIQEQQQISTNQFKENGESVCPNTISASMPPKQQQKIDKKQQMNQTDKKQYHHHNIRTLSEHSNQKMQNRRSSLVLKEKISIAFHEQQQLRQLMQEQLEKLSRQLNQKNEYLTWTVQELRIRNDLVDKLRQVLVLRDQYLDTKESRDSPKEIVQACNYEQKIQENDKQIGVLINSLIERTEETFQDFQFLSKSIKNNQNIDMEDKICEKDEIKGETQKSSKDKSCLDQCINKTYQLGVDQNIVENEREIDMSVDFILFEVQVKEERKIQTAVTLKTQSQINEEFQKQVDFDKQVDSQEQNETSQNLTEKSFEEKVLQPIKINWEKNSNQQIKYLTKQHFFEAQKRTASPKPSNHSQNYFVQNVQMIQSVESRNNA